MDSTERAIGQGLRPRRSGALTRRPIPARALGGLVALLGISAFVLSGCVINDPNALAIADAVDSANRQATSGARSVQMGVARGAGDLDEIAIQLAKVGVGYLVTEVDYPNLTSTDTAVVAIDQGADLTVTVLVKGFGQAAVGVSVTSEAHGCFDLVFTEWRPKEPEMLNVTCPKWTREFLRASGEVELVPIPDRPRQRWPVPPSEPSSMSANR